MKKLTILLLLFMMGSLLLSCEQSTTTDPIQIDQAYRELSIESELETVQLPVELKGIQITWSSNVPGTLSESYVTMQQAIDVDVTLTAVLTSGDRTLTKLFSVTILRDPSLTHPDLVTIQEYAQELYLHLTEDGTELTQDLELPIESDDIVITYLSDQPEYLDDDGTISRPLDGEVAVTVTLTINLMLHTEQHSFEIEYTVLPLEQTVVYTGYYDGIDTLMGEALKAFLHDLIDDHNVLSYSQLWDALAYTDEDPSNAENVIMLYSGVSMDEDNHGGDQNEWNREHVWPRSHGNLDENGHPGNTDLHHVRPTLVPVNGARGNLDFDEGGSLVANTTDSYKDGDSFEPRDEVKGDVARMIFYMAVRYEGDLSNENDLELNNLVNNSGPYMGKLDILLLWHFNDLPDTFEQLRNDRIYELQGNRNPFIDHPEFASYIWQN